MKKFKISIVIISFLLFILLLVNVLNNNILVLDNNFYNFIISFKSDVLTSVFKFITNFGSWYIVFIITIIFIFNKKIDNKVKLFILVNLVLSLCLNQTIKLLVARSRPSVTRLVGVTGYSFPSGHSMISFTFYGLFIYLNTKYNKNKLKYLINILLSILIILIGLSRIYLGAHFLSDVLGAYLISTSYLIIYIYYYKKMYKFE